MKDKIKNCRYSTISKFGDDTNNCEYACLKSGNAISPQDCNNCDYYDSRYIEFPIQVDKIVYKSAEHKEYDSRNCGKLVKIRVCDSNKTYLGIHLGDLPTDVYSTYNSENKELGVSQFINPAIYVFELKKVVYGCESWWGIIDSMDELSDITDEDIQSQWYVKLLQDYICKGEKKDEV